MYKIVQMFTVLFTQNSIYLRQDYRNFQQITHTKIVTEARRIDDFVFIGILRFNKDLLQNTFGFTDSFRGRPGTDFIQTIKDILHSCCRAGSIDHRIVI